VKFLMTGIAYNDLPGRVAANTDTWLKSFEI